jgi:tripartite-type tricarboxylate transporter receptor subunit TctC
LVTGLLDLMFDVPTLVMPAVADGRLRALAVSCAEEFPLIPGVPGMRGFADVGLGALDVMAWSAMMAPAGTPPAIAQRHCDAIAAALRDPVLVERFHQAGLLPVASRTPGDMAEVIRRDTPTWERLVRVSGARLTL